MLHILKNEKVKVAVNEKGQLMELCNIHSGQNYAGGGYLWRLIYQQGTSLENEIFAKDCIPEVCSTDELISIKYSALADLKIALQIDIRLNDDDVNWEIELANDEKGIIISECHFPTIEACDIKDDQALVWAHFGGQKFKNPRKEIAKHQTLYMAKDYRGIEMSTSYNAYSGAATNCFLFTDDSEGLYFGSHDPTMQTTLHLFRLRGKDLDAGFVKYPYLECGQSVKIEGCVISPYTGAWHVASKKYRKWADSWFHQTEQPEWVKTMRGWQRIILKHQYGETHYKYNQLEQIMDDGHEAGIDTLLLFGWHRDGMDNYYPEYYYDEVQGGKEELARNIKKCQEKGGRIILYFNGRLIDKATEFYQSVGKKICIKDIDGNEFLEHYKFGGSGTGLRMFGYKTFAVACPSSPEWLVELKSMADQAIELGADGVFFDQTGHGEVPCYDKNHGHPVPFTTITACKAELMDELRKYIKSRKPDMAIGNEVPLDIINQHADFVHSHILSISQEQAPEEPCNVKPDLVGFIEWLRYTFPEIIHSDREIRDDTDIERRLNFCLTRGLRSDVEIYRCRKTIKETPKYRAYMKQVNRLREKYQNLLLKGDFNDNCGLELSNPEIEATSFDNGNKKAVVLTQSYSDELSTELNVPGYSYVGHDGIGDFTFENDSNMQITLKRNAVMVIKFEQVK